MNGARYTPIVWTCLICMVCPKIIFGPLLIASSHIKFVVMLGLHARVRQSSCAW